MALPTNELTSDISVVCWLVIGVCSLFATIVLWLRIGRTLARNRRQDQANLQYALTLAIQTENFSEAACQAAATANLAQILTNHRKVEEHAATTLRTSKDFERYCKRLAKRAAKDSLLSQDQLQQILLHSYTWEFRILQEAKRQALAKEAAQ